MGFGFYGFVAGIIFACGVSPLERARADSAIEGLSNDKPVITRLKPEREKGRGYKLVYYVDAPVELVWKFKTDFDNRFVLSNRYIDAHRLAGRNGNEAVTETIYSKKPGTVFKWKSTLFAEQHFLEYVLLNPGECGQEYHYGSIRLEAADFGTRVTQVAYFDFFGVSLWVSYPFAGGMSHFLQYTARWEQKTVPEYGNE